MMPAVICLVGSTGAAQRIVADLRSSGFTRDRISVLLARRGSGPDIAPGSGWLVGLGTIESEEMGSFLAAGPILAALAAARDDGAAAGLIGVLRALGISRSVAEWYRDVLSAGQVLIAVHASDERGRRIAKLACEAGGVEGVRLTHDL